MKNLILLLAIIVLGTVSYGQKVTTFTADTITNTGNAELVSNTVSPTTDVTFIVTSTQLTGTTAGTAVFQGSIDGTTFATISTASVDSMTLTNGATFTWNTDKLSAKGYLIYRAYFTGSGTSSTKVTGKYLYWK